MGREEEGAGRHPGNGQWSMSLNLRLSPQVPTCAHEAHETLSASPPPLSNSLSLSLSLYFFGDGGFPLLRPCLPGSDGFLFLGSSDVSPLFAGLEASATLSVSRFVSLSVSLCLAGSGGSLCAWVGTPSGSDDWLPPMLTSRRVPPITAFDARAASKRRE